MSGPVKTSARIIRLDDWRNRQQSQPTARLPVERVGYRIAGSRFLIGVNVQHDVLFAPSLFPVPNTPVWSRGLANDRGNIVPVFDLGVFIGGADMSRDAHTVLILNVNGHTAGFMIDQPPQRVTAETAIETGSPVNAPALQPFLGTAVCAHGKHWWELDYHAFLLTLAGTRPGE